MKKTEQELDKLHEITMKNLYETFEEEFDAYFKFYKAAIDILSYGRGTFPFSTRDDCALQHINKSLKVMEENILNHIRDQLECVFEEKKSDDDDGIYERSDELMKTFGEKIKQQIIKTEIKRFKYIDDEN